MTTRMPRPDRAALPRPRRAGARKRPAEQGSLGLLEGPGSRAWRFTLKVMRDGRPVTVEVTSDGAGLVSHAGTALVAQVADKVGLTRALSVRLAAVKQRRRGHDPGRVIRDLAVMLVDGGECVSDLGAVREQDALFGAVASDSTAFRMVDRIASEPGLLDALRGGARAGTGAVLGAAWRAGAVDDRRRRDADHRAFGEGEGGRELQGRLRVSPACRSTWMRPARRSAACCGPGNAGSNTAEDHKAVIDRALAQIPAEYVETLEILVRADSAGATHGLVDYCREGEHALLGRLRADRAGPRRDPRDPRGRVGSGARPGRIGARRTARSVRSPTWSICPPGPRAPADRAPRASAPRRAAVASPTTTGSASKRSSPTRPTRTSRCSSAVTASTRTSRTGSATTRTPACPSSRSKSSRSTRCGWRS